MQRFSFKNKKKITIQLSAMLDRFALVLFVVAFVRSQSKLNITSDIDDSSVRCSS